MKIVVCDDDATLRSVVSRMSEDVGHTVIAETDSAHDAVELITRFGADALVLDLSLPWGTGMEAIHEIRHRELACKIIVFTSYADDSPEVRRSGVQAVVEKPDFEMLEEVLRNLASGAETPGSAAHERRKRPRERPRVPTAVVNSPSGIEEPDSIAAVVDALEAGDGVLYIHVSLPDVDEQSAWTELLQVDRFLAVARNLRTVLRVQDRLGVEEGQFKCLLLDGERAGIESVWRRLQRVEELTGGGTILNGGWSLCQEGESPYATVIRAKNACERSIGKPPGDRLWAG